MNFGMIIIYQSIKAIDVSYLDTDSFIIHIKTEDFHEDIANDVKKWFHTSDYSEDDKRPLPRVMNKKVTG